MWWRWQRREPAGKRRISIARRTEETAIPGSEQPKARHSEFRSAKAQSPAPRRKHRLPLVGRTENRLSEIRPHQRQALLSLSVNVRSVEENEPGTVFVRE